MNNVLPKSVRAWGSPGFHQTHLRNGRRALHISTAPTLGLARTKQAIYQSWSQDLTTQLDLERDLQRELGRSADYAEGVAAFTEKRSQQFRGR